MRRGWNRKAFHQSTVIIEEKTNLTLHLVSRKKKEVVDNVQEQKVKEQTNTVIW